MPTDWLTEREILLARRISDLGLQVEGSRVSDLQTRLYAELEARGIALRPTVYLSDEWGCPDGTPIIGVPFYLASEQLARIEAEHAGAVESDDEAMRYMRHEAGHAVNYAFRLHERPQFRAMFGDYGAPYREHFVTDPLSRAHVRHILGWYAQKHPDEDFAETFAVWLTPAILWREQYAGWPALQKLEWVNEVMGEIGSLRVDVPAVSDDDLPVEAMTWTIADHYAATESLAMGDGSQFDADLQRIFGRTHEASAGEAASEFVERHEGELVGRISYWANVSPSTVRSLLVAIRLRASHLVLRVAGLEATALIELTAFGTAVLVHWRYASANDLPSHTEDE